jgi:hypothetical protein
LKGKRRGKVTKSVLFLHENPPTHRALTTHKKLAYLDFQCFITHLFSESGPVGLPPVLWTEKTIERSPFLDAEVIAATETLLDGQTSEFF